MYANTYGYYKDPRNSANDVQRGGLRTLYFKWFLGKERAASLLRLVYHYQQQDEQLRQRMGLPPVS